MLWWRHLAQAKTARKTKGWEKRERLRAKRNPARADTKDSDNNDEQVVSTDGHKAKTDVDLSVRDGEHNHKGSLAVDIDPIDTDLYSREPACGHDGNGDGGDITITAGEGKDEHGTGEVPGGHARALCYRDGVGRTARDDSITR